MIQHGAMTKAVIEGKINERILFISVDDFFLANTDAIFHVEDNAVCCNSIQQSSYNMLIMQERSPFGKSELCGDYGGSFFMPSAEEIEKEAGLVFLTGHVS